jgi:hypothetical protein
MYPNATLRPIGHFLSRSWLGLAYGAILITTYFVTTSLSAAQWDSVSQTISTNMSNMEHHPVMVLIASALVADGSIVLWTTMTVVLLIVLQRWIGARWALLFAFLGNSIPTLITMASINYGLAVGWYDQSIRTTDDYGVSYVVATLLGMVFWRIPNLAWRAVYLALGIVWLSTMGLFQVPENFTALGHVTGYMIGLGFGVIAAKYLARPSLRPAKLGVDQESLGMRDYQNA